VGPVDFRGRVPEAVRCPPQTWSVRRGVVSLFHLDLPHELLELGGIELGQLTGRDRLVSGRSSVRVRPPAPRPEPPAPLVDDHAPASRRPSVGKGRAVDECPSPLATDCLSKIASAHRCGPVQRASRPVGVGVDDGAGPRHPPGAKLGVALQRCRLNRRSDTPSFRCDRQSELTGLALPDAHRRREPER
jgi:hypothetical protein